MAFNIRLTDGTSLATVEDGTINDTSCSLTLIGKNYVGYGTIYNDNLVHILENSSDNNPPNNPLTGQLWWDKAGNLKVYTGSDSGFRTISTIFNSDTQPISAVTGSSWWDITNEQLYVYNGINWILIGPAFSANVGTSGIITQSIRDTDENIHTTGVVYVQNQVVGIYSKDQEFYPEPLLEGFVSVKPGFNFISNSVISNIGLWGSASQLIGIDGQFYARTDINETFEANVTILGNLITDSNANVSAGNITASDITTDIMNSNSISVSGNITTSNINSNSATISGNLTAGNLTTGNLTAGNLSGIIRPTAGSGEAGIIWPANPGGGGGDLATIKYYAVAGESTVLELAVTNDADDKIKLNASGGTQVTGTLTTTSISAGSNATAGTIEGDWTLTVGSTLNATYADLAEKFTSDYNYPPGTVVKIGGEYEVTQENAIASKDVLGVVSTNPAYIMNSGLENSVSVALNGKVPVRVVGNVLKGDRLISAGNGLAKAGTEREITAFNVIGRSLENKYSNQEELIMTIVRTNG